MKLKLTMLASFWLGDPLRLVFWTRRHRTGSPSLLMEFHPYPHLHAFKGSVHYRAGQERNDDGNQVVLC